MVLVRSELLEQFVSTLILDYYFSRKNRENLSEQVPRPIAEKPKTFSGYFIAFLKCALNLEYFKRKYQSKSLSITEIKLLTATQVAT